MGNCGCGHCDCGADEKEPEEKVEDLKKDIAEAGFEVNVDDVGNIVIANKPE